MNPKKMNLSYIKNKDLLTNTTSKKKLSGCILKIKVTLSKKNELDQTLIGICIAHKRKLLDESITILFFSGREIIKKTFLINSPLIKEIVVLNRQHFRKSKLYNLQKKTKIVKKKTFRSHY